MSPFLIFRITLAAFLALMVMVGVGGPVRADDAPDAKAVVDKAIKALGGEWTEHELMVRR